MIIYIYWEVYATCHTAKCHLHLVLTKMNYYCFSSEKDWDGPIAIIFCPFFHISVFEKFGRKFATEAKQ